MSEAKSKNTLRIWGAGGAGANLLNLIDIPSDATGFPDTKYTIVDTSKSNLDKDQSSKSNVYLIPGVDGSGKERRFAHAVAAEHIDQILLDNPIADFNIIIFSLSGGSGSVIGPLLLEALIKRGHSVVALVITSTASAIEAKNAHDTIGTLQNLSTKKLKKPIAISFHENSPKTNRQSVDDIIINSVKSLALLVSGANHELDKKDINKWLHFDKIPPHLVDLIIYLSDGDQKLIENVTAISIANLLPDKQVQELSLGQQYSCVGYCPMSTQEATVHKIPSMHFILTNQFLADRVLNITSVVNDYKKAEEILKTNVIPTFEGDDFIF